MKPADIRPTQAPILALHGTASSPSQWKVLVQTLQPGRKVYTPELTGYGELPLGNRLGLVARLTPMLPQIQAIAGPMHLVGHSFGGALALALAELLPDKFLSVSLYEPTALRLLMHAGTDQDLALLAAVKSVAQAVSQASPLEAMGHFIDFWMGPAQWPAMSLASQQKLAAFASLASRDFDDALEALNHSHSPAPYAGPLHILCGSQTARIAKRITRLFTQQYRDCQVTCLEGLNHMGPAQQPEQVNSAILQFIEMTEESLSTA